MKTFPLLNAPGSCGNYQKFPYQNRTEELGIVIGSTFSIFLFLGSFETIPVPWSIFLCKCLFSSLIFNWPIHKVQFHKVQIGRNTLTRGCLLALANQPLSTPQGITPATLMAQWGSFSFFLTLLLFTNLIMYITKLCFFFSYA